MTFDVRLVVAEMRAGELQGALQDAINAVPYWRRRAKQLLDEIEQGVLPQPSIQALREVDARKRAAEIMQDVCCDV